MHGLFLLQHLFHAVSSIAPGASAEPEKTEFVSRHAAMYLALPAALQQHFEELAAQRSHDGVAERQVVLVGFSQYSRCHRLRHHQEFVAEGVP